MLRPYASNVLLRSQRELETLPSKVRMPFRQPASNRLVYLVQLPGKKMLRAGNHYQPILARRRFHQRLHFTNLPKLIIGPVYEQLRRLTMPQIGKIRAVHRRAQRDQFPHALVYAPHA